MIFWKSSSFNTMDSETANGSKVPSQDNRPVWKEWDVPIGRAQDVHDFIGNIRYRKLIQDHKEVYQQAPRRAQKALVAAKIYELVKSNGGRFLDKKDNRKEKDDNGNRENVEQWQEIPKDKALAKISQALRMATRRTDRSASPPSYSLEVQQQTVTTSGINHNNNHTIAAGARDMLPMIQINIPARHPAPAATELPGPSPSLPLQHHHRISSSCAHPSATRQQLQQPWRPQHRSPMYDPQYESIAVPNDTLHQAFQDNICLGDDKIAPALLPSQFIWDETTMALLEQEDQVSILASLNFDALGVEESAVDFNFDPIPL